MAVGYAIKTSDGVVGTSGTAKLVYGLHIIAGGSASTVILRNGTSTAGDAVFTLVAAANTGVTFTFGLQGVVFPNGCFYDEDANVSSATVFYQEMV